MKETKRNADDNGGQESRQGQHETGHGMYLQNGAVRLGIGQFLKELQDNFGRGNKLIGANNFKATDAFPEKQKDDETCKGNPVITNGLRKKVGSLYFKTHGFGRGHMCIV